MPPVDALLDDGCLQVECIHGVMVVQPSTIISRYCESPWNCDQRIVQRHFPVGLAKYAETGYVKPDQRNKIIIVPPVCNGL